MEQDDVVRLAFKDPLDGQIYLDLKRSYLAQGAACRPAIALTSVSNAIRSWTENVETALRQDVPKDDIIKALEELKLAADFTGEAAIDTISQLNAAFSYGEAGFLVKTLDS